MIEHPVILGIVLLLIISSMISSASTDRVRAVSAYRLEISDRVHKLNTLDLEDNKKERAALRSFRHLVVTHEQMVQQWWRSPDSFYKDCDFSDAVWNRLTAKPGSYTVKTTKVEEEPLHA